MGGLRWWAMIINRQFSWFIYNPILHDVVEIKKNWEFDIARHIDSPSDTQSRGQR